MKKNLTILEQKFVRERAKGKSQAKALRDAGSKVKDDNLHAVASRMARRPHVQAALSDILDRLYPNHEQDFAEAMSRAAQLAKESNDLKAVTDFVTKMAQIKGLAAPKETHNKTLKATVKLPSDEG